MPGLNIMALNKSGRLAIAERRAKVAGLYLLHHTQRQIAEALGCSLGTVNSDLKAIQADWQARALESLDACKWEEVARLDHLEGKYLRAWEQSCKPCVTRQVKTVKGKNPRTEVTTTEQDRDGDPAFLAGVGWCIEQRCKLLGLFDVLCRGSGWA
jgi:hypothetical protein